MHSFRGNVALARGEQQLEPFLCQTAIRVVRAELLRCWCFFFPCSHFLCPAGSVAYKGAEKMGLDLNSPSGCVGGKRFNSGKEFAFIPELYDASS